MVTTRSSATCLSMGTAQNAWAIASSASSVVTRFNWGRRVLWNQWWTRRLPAFVIGF